MRKPAVRLLCAAAVLFLTAGAAWALSDGDALVSLSHLRDVFIPQAVQKGEEAAAGKLQETYDAAKKDLDEARQSILGEEGETSLYSATLEPRTWTEGDAVTLPTGSGALLLDGAASVTHNGAFIDVTEGTAVASGGKLTAGHRYLAGEDTQAEITVLSGAARMGIQGSYISAPGGKDATPFYDVTTGDWFHDAVLYAYQNELVAGTDTNHFTPGMTMDRKMMATVLFNLAGVPAEELSSVSSSFSDVPDGTWYAPYVAWSADHGIVSGTGDGLFQPDQPITREQAAVLLYNFTVNYLEQPQEEQADLSGYQDRDQISDWAQDAMSWAVAKGLVSGTAPDQLSPKKGATRAEAAALMGSFREKML